MAKPATRKKGAVERTVRAPCADCMQETWHEIRHTLEVDEAHYHDQFDMLQCGACRRVSLRQTTNIKDEIAYAEHPFHFGMAHAQKALLAGMLKYLSERGELKQEADLPPRYKQALDDLAFHPGRYEVVTQFYPPSVSRRYPDWAFEIGAQLSGEEGLAEVFYEIYVAANNCLPHLALMGIRSIIERMMISKIGDNGSFTKNLKKFKEDGYISLLEFDHLNDILEVGHAVIHRGLEISDWELNTALSILENMLATIYIHPERASELATRVPPRPTGRKPRLD